ncbi:hypothetical protein BDQ17DRAFT_1420041 [Cyathus striatus]|nr:hypothetical protein BDQ17DRAFT_1420041 [Cyathus striatus]
MRTTTYIPLRLQLPSSSLSETSHLNMMNYRRYFPPGRFINGTYGPPRFVWFFIGAASAAFFMNLGYKRGNEQMYGRPPPPHHMHPPGPPPHGPPPPGPPPPGPPPPGPPPGEHLSHGEQRWGPGPPWARGRQWGNQRESLAPPHEEPGVALPKPAAAEPGSESILTTVLYSLE